METEKVVNALFILITVTLLACCMTGCGFMGVKRMELWKGGPNWENAINQEWAISTRELAGAAAKHAIGR